MAGKRQTRQRSKRVSQKKENREVTALGKAIRAIGGIAGGYGGGLLGHPGLGSTVGTHLGAALSRWIGAGDYNVKVNSIALKSSESIPMMHKTGQSVVVRHREFIGDITGSQAFAIKRTFEINPGRTSTFPWLAQLATNFQEYTIRGMVFHYIPTAGDAVSSTNNALGSVMFSTSYRATATPPTGKLEMLNEYFSNDARPCETFCHPLECDPRENPYNVQYVRIGDVPTGEDRKSYDLATTYVATAGMQADNVVVGEIWASYEVELRKPIAIATTGQNNVSWVTRATGSMATTTALASSLVTSATVDKFLGTVSAPDANTIVITLDPGTIGSYMLTFSGRGTTATATTWLAPTVVGANEIHSTAAKVQNNLAVANTCFFMRFFFEIVDAATPTTITIAATSYVATDTNYMALTEVTGV